MGDGNVSTTRSPVCTFSLAGRLERLSRLVVEILEVNMLRGLVAILKPQSAWITIAIVLWTIMAKTAPSLAAPPKLYEPREMWEDWITTVPVSGQVRVGVISLGEDENARLDDPERFMVYLPMSSASSLLCVIVSSKDGRYNAKLAYDMRSATPGSAGLRLPTKHGPKLSKYRARDIAILAELKSRCDGPEGLLVVAGWHERPAPVTIHVLLNSWVDATYLLMQRNGSAKTFSCAQLVESDTIAYNRDCSLPASNLHGVVELIIKRRRNSVFMEDIPLSLHVP